MMRNYLALNMGSSDIALSSPLKNIKKPIHDVVTKRMMSNKVLTGDI